MDDYLIKPVEPAELRVRVMAHLQRRTLQRASGHQRGECQHARRTPAAGAPHQQLSSRLETTPGPQARPNHQTQPSSPARCSVPTAGSSQPTRSPSSTTIPVTSASQPQPSTSAPPSPRAAPPRLPGRAGSAAPSRPAARPGENGQNRSHRILVADDEPALRRVLQRLLEQEGYVVETVEDGEEALARLLNPALTPVDLLLLDVHMPRRSGIEVLRALREASSPCARWCSRRACGTRT